MDAHKLTTFWFKKVTPSLYMIIKLLEVKNVSCSKNCFLEILSYIQHLANHVGYHQIENYGSSHTWKSVCSLETVFMKVLSPLNIHRILTQLGTKSKLACLMQVILLMIMHVVVDQDQMNDGMMWWTVPSRKKRLLKLWKGWQKIEDKEKYRQGKWKAKSAV